MTIELDGQQVESLGRAALTAALVSDGLEVARPERDSGIDLLVYDYRVTPWHVMPIQMKAATGAVFSVDQKYEPIDRAIPGGLVMVYVWNARSAETVEFYAMSWREAANKAAELGWTRTKSWEKGAYGTTRPSVRVRNAIEGYRMEPGKWRDLLDRVAE
jgi:hypothetical protein